MVTSNNLNPQDLGLKTPSSTLNPQSSIFVAGHRGLVGSAILRRLKAEGFTNIVTRIHADLDLTDPQLVAKFFEQEKPEYVFLAAAKVGGIHANNTYPAEFIYQNLVIQTHVIHQSYLHGVKKLLFLGSSCIYPKQAPQPLKEEYLMTGPLEPTNSSYAVAKIAGIEMCRSYNRQYGTQFIPIMPTNLYGSNDNFDLENSHVLPALIRKFHLAKLAEKGAWEAIRKDETSFGKIPLDIMSNLWNISRANGHTPPSDVNLDASLVGATARGGITLWGTGSPKREFLYVDDLADACVYLMTNYNGTDLLNIGTGKDLTIKELAAIVTSVVGFKGEIFFDVTRPDGTPRKLLNVNKLSTLGWVAKTDLEDGIRKTYDWYLRKVV